MKMLDKYSLKISYAKSMWAKIFKQRYLESLKHNYSLFYDDIHEYGNINTAKHGMYFIPGLNGAPGQARFALPGIRQVFGTDIYVRCTYFPEFSMRNPTWEKYTFKNVDKKTIKTPTHMLVARHDGYWG